MLFSQRIAHLEPEGAYIVLAQAQAMEAQGKKVIHLEIGQPDFETYANISLAGIKAITDGKTGYNPAAGIPELREALAQDIGRRRRIPVSADQVVVAPGAKPLLFLPLLALLNAGDEVIYPDPGFPTYLAAIEVAGARPVPLPLDEESGFDLDLNALDDLLGPRTRMIVLNSPANPTGGVLSLETIERVAEIARERDLWVLSDEIYSRLAYDTEAPSIISQPGMQERTILVDGFSKTYAMTGWRLGYGIVPAPLAQKLSLLLVHSVGCTATFTQYAGLEAITGPQDQAEAVRQAFQKRRDRIVAGLNDIPGFRCHMPQGAFYAFPNVKALNKSVEDLAQYLLENAGVALLPGTSFGANGDGFLRLSYANSLDNIDQALGRIKEAVRKL